MLAKQVRETGENNANRYLFQEEYKYIECFHSRGQHLCKCLGTKESVCIRKEFNSQRTGLGHQHGHRFIVLGHQYGRRDVMRKRSIPIPKKCCTVNLILTDTSFFFTIDLSTLGTALSASTRNSKTLTTFKRGAKFEVCHMEN